MINYTKPSKIDYTKRPKVDPLNLKPGQSVTLK